MKLLDEIDFCLLVPCYNNFHGLIQSLKSVVYPTGKFLVLVVDDGSKETVTAENVNNEIGEKKPVIVLHNEMNLGITAALNKGLSWIKENTNARYIARLDCGDICSEERFVMQVRYMDEHPEIGLAGSWCWFEDKKIKERYPYKTPSQHKDIIRAMYFRNVFIHPTVIFPTALLKVVGYYPEGFEHAEDYAFFWKLIKIKQSFVFDKFLVICELNKRGISYRNKRKQLVARGKVVKTFGPNLVLRIIAYIRLAILFILPGGIVLQIKKWKG